MYNYIVSFLTKKQAYPFSREYRREYKTAWINSIKDYSP